MYPCFSECICWTAYLTVPGLVFLVSCHHLNVAKWLSQNISHQVEHEHAFNNKWQCVFTLLWGGFLWWWLWSWGNWNFFIFLIWGLTLWGTLKNNKADHWHSFKVQSLGDFYFYLTSSNLPGLVRTCSAQIQILPHCLYCLWHFLNWKDRKVK